MKSALLKYGAVAAVFTTAGYLIGHQSNAPQSEPARPGMSAPAGTPTPARPTYRDTSALSEQFYRPASSASFYELGAGNKLVYKGSFPISTCIEILDGHAGIETARVKIASQWKPDDSFTGYIYKDELVRAPECKPEGP